MRVLQDCHISIYFNKISRENEEKLELIEAVNSHDVYE